MMGLLVSVRDREEAAVALQAGVDILDLKEPAHGALGAVAHDTVRGVVEQVAGRCKVSATIGDLPPDPELLAPAAREMAATGVDYVKIGFFANELMPAAALLDAIGALAEVAKATPLVAVMFADQGIDLRCVDAAARAGYTGIMLDTADKHAGRLCDVATLAQLEAFVVRARQAGLMTGLAGSLRFEDIAVLRGLNPDYLGFRGAACSSQDRVARLDGARVRHLRAAVGEFGVMPV